MNIDYRFLILAIILIFLIIGGFIITIALSNRYAPFKRMKKKEIKNCYLEVGMVYNTKKKKQRNI